MNLELHDKVAYVGGSSRGIGLAVAKAFVREGAHVVLTGRTSASLDAASAECRTLDPSRQVLSLQGDLTLAEDVDRTLQETTARLGSVDIVVANVGSGTAPIGWRLSVEDWEASLRTNLLSSMMLATQAIPLLIASGGGALVFVSSIAGWEAIDAPIPYGAAKVALLSSMKTLSRQVAQNGIRVTAVVPGNVFAGAGVWDRKMREHPQTVERYISDNVPLQRFGTPEEIADAVVFLASSRAAFVTGACLVVDGGQTRSW